MLSCYHERMAKSTHVNVKTPKKRAAVTGDLVGVRIQPEMATELDGWRRKQADLPGRPEAIRRLVEIALSSERPKPRRQTIDDGYTEDHVEADRGRPVRRQR